MLKLKEKRHNPRHHGQGRLTLLLTHHHNGNIKGGLINFSAQGIRFFSHRALFPGNTILVRASGENYQYVSPDSDCQLRTMGFCTIKWCQKVNRQGVPYHEMGAVYVTPY
jgi:hypothetical protein